MITFRLDDVPVNSTVSCFQAQDVFDPSVAELSGISAVTEGDFRLATTQAVSSYVSLLASQIQRSIDDLSRRLSSSSLVDSAGRFYMPDGLYGGAPAYRRLSAYVEEETGEPLAELSKARYVRGEDGEFQEITDDE